MLTNVYSPQRSWATARMLSNQSLAGDTNQGLFNWSNRPGFDHNRIRCFYCARNPGLREEWLIRAKALPGSHKRRARRGRGVRVRKKEISAYAPLSRCAAFG